MSLDNLTDRENMLLTQLSYSSHILNRYKGKTIIDIYKICKEKDNGFSKKEMGVLEELALNPKIAVCKLKDASTNNTSGFGAIAIEDENGNVGISYRGTDGFTKESMNDWVDNAFATLTGVSPQVLEAETFYLKNKNNNGKNYLYGHSKGGNLSETVYVNHYDEIEQMHLLNPQPINPYSLTPDQLKALNSKKVDIVVNEGDYVWFLGIVPYKSRIKIAKGTNKDAHSFAGGTYDENGNVILGNQELWNILFAAGLHSLGVFLQYNGQYIGSIYHSVVRITNYIKDDLIPEAMEFIDTIIKEFQKLGEDISNFANDLYNYFNQVIVNSKNLYNSNLNVGYQYATANPYIRLNTSSLYSYANRLISVNKRITNLDRRLDNLYWSAGLLDLWNLMQADLLTGYSWRLQRCINYLNETAADFDAVERKIASKF